MTVETSSNQANSANKTTTGNLFAIYGGLEFLKKKKRDLSKASRSELVMMVVLKPSTPGIDEASNSLQSCGFPLDRAKYCTGTSLIRLTLS
jgi:hypothetical protein